MNETIQGIFIDYNIVLDERTNRQHLAGICKTGHLTYVLLITAPVINIAQEQKYIRTVDGIYYLQSSEKLDFYQKLVESMNPISIQSERFISNCSLVFH